MKGKVLIISLIVIAFIAGGLWFWHSSGNTSEMIHPTALWAFGLGAISAVSLPLGLLAGILFKPKASITAAFTAFGAGALMAALSVELILQHDFQDTSKQRHKQLQQYHTGE